jgi:hypothetical protein
VTGILALTRVRLVLLVSVLAGCWAIGSGASAEPVGAASGKTSSMVGRWETVRTCQGLVISARLAGLGPIAPVIVGDYFPKKSPQQLARKRNLCSGAKVRLIGRAGGSRERSESETFRAERYGDRIRLGRATYYLH